MFSYCTPCYGTENQRKSAKVWWQKFVPVKRLLVYKKGVSLSINKVDSFTEYFSENAKITEITTQKEKLFIAYFFTWIIRDFPLDNHTGYFKCRKTKKQKQTKVIRKRKYLADVWLMRMMYDWRTLCFLFLNKKERCRKKIHRSFVEQTCFKEVWYNKNLTMKFL